MTFIQLQEDLGMRSELYRHVFIQEIRDTIFRLIKQPGAYKSLVNQLQEKFLGPFYKMSILERNLGLPAEGVNLSQPPHLAPVFIALFRLDTLNSIAALTNKHISLLAITGVIELCKDAIIELEKSGAKEAINVRRHFEISNESYMDELVDKYKKIKAGQLNDIRFS